MYSITSQFYSEIAQRLCDVIDGESYFSGSVSFVYMDVEWRLTLSVIVHRDGVSSSDQECSQIVNLVPVWWEFHTYEQGVEFINDFSFRELKMQII